MTYLEKIKIDRLKDSLWHEGLLNGIVLYEHEKYEYNTLDGIHNKSWFLMKHNGIILATFKL